MAYEIIEEYKKLVAKDLAFNRFSVQELAKRVPGLKGFWAGKLVDAKIDLRKLEIRKRDLLEELQNKKPEVGMSKASLEKAALNADVIKNINLKIDEYKVLIEYLEHVMKIFHGLNFDVKNFIDTLKTEDFIPR